MATIVSLGLFSHEANNLSPAAIILSVASLALQLPPTGTSHIAWAAASLIVGGLAFLLLVRHPRRTTGHVVGALAVVTGCSTGIGLETASQLLAAGMTVIFACRSEARARVAMRRALSAAGGVPEHRAIFVPLDLSSCASVVACAARIAEEARRHKKGSRVHESEVTTSVAPVHALVCNAGGFAATRTLTIDGIEQSFGANFLAHALLVRLLLPQLRAAPGGARVVSVSSSMHKTASVGDLLADPQSARAYGIFSAYARSKLAQVVWSCEMQRREAPDGITYVACHPGNAQTEVSRNFPPPMHQLYAALQPLLRCAQAGLGDAASTPVYAVTGIDPDGALRGTYLERSAVVRVADEVADEAAGRRLHALCEEMLQPWLAGNG